MCFRDVSLPKALKATNVHVKIYKVYNGIVGAFEEIDLGLPWNPFCEPIIGLLSRSSLFAPIFANRKLYFARVLCKYNPTPLAPTSVAKKAIKLDFSQAAHACIISALTFY